MSVRLGKLAPRHDARTLRMEKYLDFSLLPTPPSSFDYGDGGEFPMYLNDRIGDCTCAAMAHAMLTWNRIMGHPITITDDDVLAAYIANSGYNPLTGQHDDGCVELDVLNYARQTGIAGHKIGAFGDLGVADMNAIYTGMFIFKGLYIGVSLPQSCLTDSVWDIPHGPIVGGHAIYFYGKNSDGSIKARTWTRKVTVTPRFLQGFFDELHLILSPEYLTPGGLSLEGLDVATLNADLDAITNMESPPMPIPVTPPPTPGPTPPPTPGPAPILTGWDRGARIIAQMGGRTIVEQPTPQVVWGVK